MTPSDGSDVLTLTNDQCTHQCEVTKQNAKRSILKGLRTYFLELILACLIGPESFRPILIESIWPGTTDLLNE